MALPNTNISTTLVGQTLGSGSRDVGTLCTHPNINKWSRWKPVAISNQVEPVTIEDLAGAQYGLNIPFFSTRAELISYYNSNSGEWTYTKPSGGASSPYRLGDFRNYEHSASKFYSVIIPEMKIGGGNVTIEMSFHDIIGGLTWSDFLENINNLHFGVIASNGQTVIESEPITADNVGYVTIPTTSSITSYTFLAEVSPIDPNNILRYYALEGGSGYTQYDESGVGVSIYAWKFIDEPIVNVTATFTRMAGGPTGLNNISIQVRYGDKDPSDPLVVGEATHNFGNISFNAGNTQEVHYPFRNVLPEYNTRGGYVYLRVTSLPSLNQMSFITNRPLPE